MKSAAHLISASLCVLTIGAFVAPGCSRPVGQGADPDATVEPDGQVHLPDASTDAAWPDAGGLVQVRGWRAEAFEHSAFVPETSADEAALDRCEPYLMAAEGAETWWVGGTAAGDLLPFFPNPEGTERIALMTATGFLSPPGIYGHDGSYQREIDLVSWDVHVCDTVARLGHCVLPRAEHYCLFPEPEHEYGIERHLVRILPGPAGPDSPYELSVVYNPGVADGVTIFRLDFSLPVAPAPNPGTWDVFEVDALPSLSVREIREWIYYEEIPYPNTHAGWILRHRESDTLLVSISARAADDRTVHLWGHFPVTEVIAYP